MCIASVDAAERDPIVLACSTALEVHVTIMHYTNLHFTYYSGGLGAPPQWGSVNFCGKAPGQGITRGLRPLIR